MVSPVHGDYRRCQAETPLIVLFRFPGPALNIVLTKVTATRITYWDGEDEGQIVDGEDEGQIVV